MGIDGEVFCMSPRPEQFGCRCVRDRGLRSISLQLELQRGPPGEAVGTG